MSRVLEALDVLLQFLVDVDQTGRDRHALANGEAQTVGLARTVVGVLAQNHNLKKKQNVTKTEEIK